MQNRHIIMMIMVGVLIWASLLAVGAYLGGERLVPDVRRGMIVFAAPLTFLGVWLALLLRRGRQKSKEDDAP